MAGRRVSGFSGLQQAFDEVRFGNSRTLNLRTSLPTASEAAHRVENWLRQHQALKSGEVLVITGRGNNSEGGVSVVREAAIRVFHDMRRKSVITEFVEHTTGSFVVSLAPMSAIANAATARDALPVAAPASPPTLASLSADTRQLLRVLAERSLDTLGVRERGPFLEDEMLRLFGSLAGTIKAGEDREPALRRAIAAAMNDYD
ncbi:MAG: Smr protein/MutS2 [Gemmatimonadetes bacterium]|nr:Smr protein/MutS2 [Gemmatimonadota bacterium]